jgi:hypothetical protein
VLDRIRAFLLEHDPTLELDDTTLEALLRQGRFLLLMDGLNELPSEAARRDVMTFRKDFNRTPMIFTTRDLSVGGDFGIEKTLEMQPLTETQMQQFIQAYLPEQAEQMLRQLKDRLREFGQTPLLLWMLCELFRQTQQIPLNLGMVFRVFTQSYERNLKHDVAVESDRDHWSSLLQYLAFVMMQGEKRTELRIALQRQEVIETFTQFLEGKVPYPEDYGLKSFRDLLKYHLIQVGANDDIEFRSQLIQEYYAAEYLLKQLHLLGDDELKHNYLNYLKWTEPVALMLALTEDKTQAVRVIKLALEIDLLLGVSLIEAVKPEFQEQIMALIKEPAMFKLLKSAFQLLRIELISISLLPYFLKLGLVGSRFYWSTSVKLLQARFKFYNYEFFQSPTSKATPVKGVKNEPTVIDVFGSFDNISVTTSNINQASDNSGKRINNTETLPALVRILNNEDESVRISAIEALGEIGSQEALEALVKILNDQNPNIRSKVAEALGKIGSESAAASLISSLSDQEANVRSKAAEALGKIGSESAVNHLMRTLNDKNISVRASAAKALGELRSLSELHDTEEEIQQLLTKLEQNFDSEPLKKKAAIAELSKNINQNQALRKHLINALKTGGLEALKAIVLLVPLAFFIAAIDREE